MENLNKVTAVTDTINKQPNLFGGQKSYRVEKQRGRFYVAEFVNSVFDNHVVFKSEEAAIKRLLSVLTLGDTANPIVADNEYMIEIESFLGYNYRFDKILHKVTRVK
tara:strand:- start:6027 stop:6347 length:321 start_codon:yes stop_codon:yes gene_type:complete